MLTRRLPAGRAAAVEICFSDRADGDFRIDGPSEELAARRQNLMAGEWTWLRQVHGSRVVEVTVAGEHAGTEADASVTVVPGAVLAVQTADCVPVVLVADGGVAVAHAGWRGVVEGVLAATTESLRELTKGSVEAVIGPCIGPGHYEFGETELAMVEEAAGPEVRGVTLSGTPALDMAAAVRSVLRAAGVDRVGEIGRDTAGEDWFSHRVRGDVGRQVTAARLVPR